MIVRGKSKEQRGFGEGGKRKVYKMEILQSTENSKANNKVKKFYKIPKSINAGFQPRISLCMNKDGNIIGKDKMVTKRRWQHF